MQTIHRNAHVTPAAARALIAHGRSLGVSAHRASSSAAADDDFADLSPITRAFIGSLRGASADTEEYIDYLARKHAFFSCDITKFSASSCP